MASPPATVMNGGCRTGHVHGCWGGPQLTTKHEPTQRVKDERKMKTYSRKYGAEC
ncbi:hypothetical protein XENOCAPTIV_029289, partial [Xenoophorus captivus]